MKIQYVLFFLMLAFSSCFSNAEQTGDFKTISAAEYQQMLNAKKDVLLIDVRTPEEFAEEHLKQALNIDYNGADFKGAISKLDKTKSVMIYCLSGGRSSSAMKVLAEAGFHEVYNLKGGILQWKAAGMPTSATASAAAPEWKGMTKEAYQQLIAGEVPVVIDFNAKWCGPCKQLKPILDEIQKEYAGKIKIIPIDIDENKSLAQSMYVNNIPLLVYHENGKVILNQEGFLDKEGLIKLFKLK